jgi:tetratricopeptide (TPR) repeat protein
MKTILVFLILPLFLFSQEQEITDTVLKKSITDQLSKNIYKKNVDDACNCIDSISTGLPEKEKNLKIKECIDREVVLFQTMEKMLKAINATKDVEIGIVTDKNSREYKIYYNKFEAILFDSCTSLVSLVKSIDVISSKYSISNDARAREEYYLGIEADKKENIKHAITHYEKALKIDSLFVFAWDNLGLSYRKLNKIDKAIYAYEKSLSIDSTGKMPLHNLPVAYEMSKNYDMALKKYLEISKLYPDDPEAFYGSSRMYIFKENYENALEDMCTAYNLYVKQNSPYKGDAVKMINMLYHKFKEINKLDVFDRIMKENHISY